MESDRKQFLPQIASWYYEDSLSQEDIAERIGRSRSLVSRLLQEAHENGVVEIRVHFPLKRDPGLESRLCETFPRVQPWILAPPTDHAPLLRRRTTLLTGVCWTIVERMTASVREAPQFTISTDVGRAVDIVEVFARVAE
ncbi:MAG: Deoxyribonucleoside regulator [Anaerolineales bacterium]|nr:Deoxyribonucleoside regulator [Anaerolineales bacterium]